MITDKKIPGKLKKIEARYTPYCFEAVCEVPVEYCETEKHFRTVPGDEVGMKWRPAEAGTRWGGPWRSAWFKGRVELPSELDGEKVFVRAQTGGVEALFLVDGVHNGVFDGNHPVVMMAASGVQGKTYKIAVEAYAGTPLVGTQPDDSGAMDFERRFERIELMRQREDVLGFVFDLKVLLQLMEALDENSLRRHRVLAGLAEVYAVVDALPAERPEASWRPKLARARKIMKPLLAAKNGPSTPVMGILGHAHIDTAWLWTVAETERKCARTFSSMLNLMAQYPEVRFIQSAPYHADIVRREYPGIFERMREVIRSGRWEPNGAMWVEPDCNIPSGEAFVRQLLFGQQATRAWFGYTSDALWQPDVFGYSAALPQILRGCGVEFFLTTKISWNDTTRFPYDTFVWEGIDGSQVTTHFYNIHCWPDPKTLTDQWNYLQHKDVEDRRLSAFGYGDGGGGPQFEMMEIARRTADLEGCPRTQYTSVSDFMKGIRDDLNLPIWVGELYLELHRGTLTSIAQIKRGNRRAELALRDAEFLCCMAARAGGGYPGQDLEAAWKKLLVNQFHDILPGSSIPEVNDQAIAELEQSVVAAQELGEKALDRIAGPRSEEADAAFVVNTLSWDREGEMVLEGVPGGTVAADPEIASQWVEGPDGRKRLAVAGLRAPALGAARLDLMSGECDGRSVFKLGKHSVETPFARIRFDRKGRMVSFTDKESGRQLVRKGGAFNVFWVGEDVPAGWDNWDLDFDQQFKMREEHRLVRREVVADGPLQLRLRSEYEIGDGSRMVQDMVFHSTTPRVDFETVVDWNETHMLLKVGFATDMLSMDARHEIQYGHVERPTHTNQLADRARFEVCNHKWTDLSENRFGVALLNDCKYGIGVHGGDMRLTLLKSGTHPDPRGDRGRHTFTYALKPHACGFSVESVVRPAYELNVAPVVRPVDSDAEGFGSLLTVDAPNVIVEAVKWAEEGNALVVRLYEAERSGCRTKIRFHVDVGEVAETNMLEENPQVLKVRGGAVEVYFRPFEIKTLRVEVP